MRLVSLRIETLPGIERPWSLDGLAPGVSVVVGPNASGKSSLVRAARALLTPEALPDGAVHVEARFEENGTTWRASRLGTTVRWDRDGRPAEAPVRLAAGSAAGMFLGLEELLRFTEADRDLATRLATELAGGIDLPAARHELGPVGPRFGRAQADVDREARRRHAEAQRARDALRRDEVRLADLRGRAARAERRAADAEPVRAARELLATREELASLERRLAGSFPAGMELLHPATLDAIDTATTDVERAREELRAARAALETAEAEARATGLDPERPSEPDVAAWQAAAQELTAAEREVRAADDDVAEAQARWEDLRAASGDRREAPPTAPDAGPLSPARLDELEGWAHERDEAERELRAMARERDRLGPRPEPTDDPDALQRAMRLLSAWLAAPDPGRVVRARLARLASTAALAAAIVAALLAIPSPPSGTPAIALGVAAAALAVSLALDVSARHRGRRRAEIVRAYGDAATPPPDGWREGPVRERLLELARRRAGADHAARRAVEHDARSRDLADAEVDLATRRDHAAERLLGGLREAGLDDGWADRPALGRLRRVDEIRRAHAELAGARARRDERARRSESLRTWIESEMDGLAASDGEAHPTSLREHLRALGERVRRRDAASSNADAGRRDARRAEEELALREERRATLLVESGVRSSADDARAQVDASLRELARRAERLPDWRELVRRRGRLTGRADDLEARLDGRDELLAAVDARDRAALDARASEAADAESERDRLRDEASRIEQRLETAHAERPVEAARAEARRARDELEAAHERALDAEAVAVLLDHVEERHRTVRRPALLRRAERWFARFTHHAFELAFESSGPEAGAIRARDVAAERVRELGELSTGTKAQLLLALRLAQALENERGGPTLPLFLDEALTTSDPERFAAVVDALSQLVRDEGRQIVYLTARRDDAALWTRLAEREGAEPPRVLDLAAGRADAAAAGGPDAYAVAAPTPPPAPTGRSPEAYAAELGVPAVDPWRIPALHPFHLLRDRLDLLHRLVTRRITTLAAVERLLADAEHAGHLAGPEERAILAARASAARAWATSWRVGRGRPVDRAALEASGAVTETFLDDVDALAREVGGDASAMLTGLAEGRVRFFRDAARERLEAFLRETGHLDGRDVLIEGERIVALDRALAPAGGGDVAPADLATWLEGGLASNATATEPDRDAGPPQDDGVSSDAASGGEASGEDAG